MATTLQNLIDDVNSHLDEPVAYRYFTQAELTRWLNEGARDIARRGECLPKKDTSITLVPATQYYAFPNTNVVRVHFVEAVINNQIWPLEFRTRAEMQQIWGIQQSITQSYPSYVVFTGFPGNLSNTLQLELFPIPSLAGTLNVYYWAFPTAMVATTDNLDLPDGWQDLVVMYAEYMCLRKGKDSRWQEAKKLYEERLSEMIDRTRNYHDQAQVIVTGTAGMPYWLYEPGDW